MSHECQNAIVFIVIHVLQRQLVFKAMKTIFNSHYFKYALFTLQRTVLNRIIGYSVVASTAARQRVQENKRYKHILNYDRGVLNQRFYKTGFSERCPIKWWGLFFYDFRQTWLVSFPVRKNNLTLARRSVHRRKMMRDVYKGEISSAEPLVKKYREFYRIQRSINTFDSYPFPYRGIDVSWREILDKRNKAFYRTPDSSAQNEWISDNEFIEKLTDGRHNRWPAPFRMYCFSGEIHRK